MFFSRKIKINFIIQVQTNWYLDCKNEVFKDIFNDKYKVYVSLEKEFYNSELNLIYKFLIVL